MFVRLRSRFIPLRVRLPLVVVALLAVCTGGVVLVSYRAVRLSTASTAVDQLRSAAERVAGVLGQQSRRAIVDAQSIGTRAAIAQWLAAGTDVPAARAVLDSVRLAGAQAGAIQATRRDGSRIVTGDSALADALEKHARTPGVSPFFAYGARVAWGLSAPLVAGDDTLGRVEVAQLLHDTAAATSLISGLIGKDARLLIGDSDDSLWTNMATPVPAPVSSAALARLLAPNRRPPTSADTLGAAAAVPNAPWVVWVGQPAGPALAAATSVMWKLVLLGALVSLAGGLVAWMLIRLFTRPIDELAHASELLARGEYGPRMTVATGDEIGRLTASFNDMAERIERHRMELEDQVSERTVALEKALFDLQLAQEENVKRARLAVLGQLAGGVGHELRNPLGVMTNAIFVLESVISEPIDIVRDYLGILRGQIALSEKIISDLLDFARTKPAARMPTTADTLVRAQVARLDPPKNVTIDIDIPESLPPVHVDPVQIGQVVFNLVMNGVQAMADTGGTLRCHARHDGNGTLSLEVADTGPGIPPDVAKRIFEPLFTTKVKGLGLGLTVSRMLAENNGGQLTFQSVVGQGTSFFLSMPTAV